MTDRWRRFSLPFELSIQLSSYRWTLSSVGFLGVSVPAANWPESISRLEERSRRERSLSFMQRVYRGRGQIT